MPIRVVGSRTPATLLLLAFAVASGVAIDPAACSAAGTCVSEIQDLLNACDASPAPSCSITLPPGIYALDATGAGTAALLSAPSAPNVKVSADGVAFNLTGAAGVISVGASSNFSIVGLTIDMQRSAYTLGSVSPLTPQQLCSQSTPPFIHSPRRMLPPSRTSPLHPGQLAGTPHATVLRATLILDRKTHRGPSLFPAPA